RGPTRRAHPKPTSWRQAGSPRCLRWACLHPSGKGRDEVAAGALSGINEPIGEAIGLALDRGIEHLDRVLIVLVREHWAFGVQYEAGRLHFLTHGCSLNPMQRLSFPRARPDGGCVIYDDIRPTWLQPLVDGSIEVGRRRAL